ncbi:MAG: hypothetical protein WEB00_12075 [Dehalococcoidia bacterium]
MPEPVLFVPPLISEAAARTLPNIRELVEALDSSFDLEVFRWAGTEGGPDIEPTWQAMAGSLAPSLGSRHVVSTGWSTALVLAAISRAAAQPASLVARGMIVPPATLRGLGLQTEAEAALVAFSLGARPAGTIEMTRIVSPHPASDSWGGPEEQVDEGIEWPFYERFMGSYAGLDLTGQRLDVTFPALLLWQAGIGMPGYDETGQCFQRLVPGGQAEEVEEWAGPAAVTRAVAFIREVASAGAPGRAGGAGGREAARRGRPPA